MRRLIGAVLILAGVYAAMAQGVFTAGAAFWLAVIVVAVWLGPLRLARFVLGVALMGRALGG